MRDHGKAWWVSTAQEIVLASRACSLLAFRGPGIRLLGRLSLGRQAWWYLYACYAWAIYRHLLFAFCRLLAQSSIHGQEVQGTSFSRGAMYLLYEIRPNATAIIITLFSFIWLCHHTTKCKQNWASASVFLTHRSSSSFITGIDELIDESRMPCLPERRLRARESRARLMACRRY